MRDSRGAHGSPHHYRQKRFVLADGAPAGTVSSYQGDMSAGPHNHTHGTGLRVVG